MAPWRVACGKRCAGTGSLRAIRRPAGRRPMRSSHRLRGCDQYVLRRSALAAGALVCLVISSAGCGPAVGEVASSASTASGRTTLVPAVEQGPPPITHQPAGVEQSFLDSPAAIPSGPGTASGNSADSANSGGGGAEPSAGHTPSEQAPGPTTPEEVVGTIVAHAIVSRIEAAPRRNLTQRSSQLWSTQPSVACPWSFR